MKTLLRISHMGKLFVFVSMLIMTHTGMAQWRIANPSNVTPTDITYASSTIGYEVGYSGYLTKTTDGGLTWQALTSGTSAHLYTVNFVSPTEGYVGGNILMKTIDGGTTWVTLDHMTAESGVIHSIYFVNADTGWYCTDLGKIFRTTDAGASWIQYHSSTGSAFSSIWFIDSFNGWVVGTNGRVLKTSNGGINWTTQSVTGTSSPITTVQFISSTHGWISNQAGHVFRTTDGGTTWTSTSSIISAYLNEIQFLSTTTGWAATNTGVHKTTDGGATWNQIGLSGTIDDLYFYSLTNGSVADDGGVNSYTTNGGSAWTDAAENLNITTNGYGVHFINANKGWMVGAGGLLRTTNNGGNTWSNMTSGVSTLLLSVFFTSANDGWIAGVGGVIRKTTDGGNSWTAQASGVTTYLYHMTFTSSTTGIVVGDQGRILRTTNSGTNWNIMTSGSTEVLRSVFFVPATTTGWVVGHNGTILKTTDGGVNWTTQSSGTTSNLLNVFFTSTTHGCVVGADGTIRRTTDGGTTWTTATSNTVSHLTSLFFTSPTSGWALGYNGVILRTGNGGATWINYGNYGGGQPINSIFFTSADKGYAVGNAGLKLEFNTTCTPPVPVDYTFPSGNNICTNTTATLKAGGIGILGWYSAASGGTYLGSGSTFTTPVLSASATYYVQDSTCSASASRTAITVTPVSTFPSLSLSGVGYTIGSVQGSAKYQWLDCNNGNPILLPGHTAQNYTIDSIGEYSVIVNLNGCIDTSACISMPTTSVRDLSNTDEINLFPNPSLDKIMLQCTNSAFNSSPARIRLMDMVGNTVFQKNATVDNYILEMTSLHSGMYVLEIASEGQYFRRNIIKQ